MLFCHIKALSVMTKNLKTECKMIQGFLNYELCYTTFLNSRRVRNVNTNEILFLLLAL